MSEIQSQAIPESDELAEVELIDAIRATLEGWPFRKQAAAAAVEVMKSKGWSKHRTVNSAAELMDLPKCSLIRALEREGQRSGEVYEKIGPDHWLALDPGDRFDGEETTPSHAILRIYKAGIRVLFTPGGA